MKISGEKQIKATPEEIWAQLLDPDVLKQCVPGCEEVEITQPLTYRAVATIKVGPVKARFSGDINIVDIDDFKSCRLVGKGSGGVAGYARGNAMVQLTPAETGTRLSYDCEVQIGGKIASLGDRLFRSIAEKNVDSFFASFQKLTDQNVSAQ